MNIYLLLKTLHIVSSVLLVGTGFGSAFYMYFTLRGRNLAVIADVSRLVVRADWYFTTPAVIVQPLTGWLLMRQAGYSLQQDWLLISLMLYVLAGLCWLPVVCLQLRMADMADKAAAVNAQLPENFWRYARWWAGLGYPAFVAMLLIYWLMVNKPLNWI